MNRPVELQLRVRLIDQAQLTASLIALVVLLREVIIVDKAFETTVEASHRKGELVAGTMVVSHLYITIQTCSNAKTDVRTLIVHGVLGVDTHQSTLGVLSVKGTLRSTQDIHTVEHIEMIVEGSLRHQGDVIVIDTHCRTVDT